MTFGDLHDESFKPIKPQWDTLLLEATMEDVYADFPFTRFLKTYWADDKTWPVVEQAVFYVYERVRSLPLTHNGVLSENNTLFQACLLMAFEAIQITFTGLYYIREPLLKREEMLKHLKLMSFLSGLFAPMVRASESLAMVTFSGNLYDFKKTLVEFTGGDEVVSDVGFVGRTIPRVGYWESFSSAMSKELMAMIETSVADPTLVVAFKSLLKGEFAEMYQVNPNLFRVIAIAENKMVRRIMRDKGVDSSTEKVSVSHYPLAYGLCDYFDSLNESEIDLHPAMNFAGGEVYVKRIGFFEGVAQCMNTAIDEILWQENDLYKAALNAGVITTKLDKDDEENLRSVGVDEIGGLSKIVNPTRFIPRGSTAHIKLVGENDPYMGIPGYSPEAYMDAN